MSRIPRAQEHFKIGFANEAASAARFRALAKHAETAGLVNLAGRWRELAEAKDGLAALLLEAAGQVRAPERALADSIADERYENEVLYPKMIGDLDADAVEILREVVAAQEEHVKKLEELRTELLSAAGGDLGS